MRYERRRPLGERGGGGCILWRAATVAARAARAARAERADLQRSWRASVRPRRLPPLLAQLELLEPSSITAVPAFYALLHRAYEAKLEELRTEKRAPALRRTASTPDARARAAAAEDDGAASSDQVRVQVRFRVRIRVGLTLVLILTLTLTRRPRWRRRAPGSADG